jgi:peptidoglycan/LPS O-acetylase OafA/YrhL
VSRQDRGRFPELDALRALAVILVVWSHTVGGDLGVGESRVGGYHGVTLFFVISGFLITGILLDARRSIAEGFASPQFALRAFYIRRFLRIFPVYYAVLFIAFATGYDAVRAELGWHLAYLSNWYFAHRGGFGNSTAHLWSLAVEEQFYLAWPWFALLLPRGGLAWTIGGMILAGPLTRLALAHAHGNAHELAVWIITPAVLDSLGLGCLLAYLSRETSLADRFAQGALVVAVSLAALRETVLPLDGSVTLHAALSLTPWALLCVWLVHRASRGFPGRIGRLLRAGPLLYVGKVSYGIYLVHLFVMVGVPRLERMLGLDALTLSQPGWRHFALVMPVSLVAAALSWRFLEEPINSLKARFPYAPRARPEDGVASLEVSR